MSAGRRALVGSLACALACVAACRGAAGSLPAGQPVEGRLSAHLYSFRLDKAALRANGASEALLDEIGSSAYRYFRALAEPSKHRTCEAFRELRWRLPSGPVHGDAHLEQFVVTDNDHGLADFDNAGFGPAIVDLVRYATSLHLACREISGGCDPEQAVAAYFNAYKTALDHPVRRGRPEVVARLRGRDGPEPEAWLRWADALSQPLAAADEEKVRRNWTRFVALMRETSPERPEHFYRIVRLGSLEMGLGSALERKMLVRIAGPTDDPGDDVILEGRTHSLPEYRGCIWRPTGGSLNVFMLTSMLARPLPEVFGVLPNPGGNDLPEIWIHSWERGYRELSLSDVQGQADLDALAADAGTQLAGHFWTTYPEELRSHQRFIQLRAFELTDHRARDLARSLARDVVTEWRRFRGQAEMVAPASAGADLAGPASAEQPKALIDGTGPGWRTLGPNDFARVNDSPDTWKWDGAVLTSTGVPIGVMRTRDQFRNFELVVEWRHLKPAGNSGVFAWVPMKALDGLPPDQLPNWGIEVQMLDHGYRPWFRERNPGKPDDWFTTDGDIFAVGKSKLEPFEPRSPNGSRSFPRKALSRGAGEWNHYYVRAINGEIRLWVNGEEVSGGRGADPSTGYLCLEAEGSPVEFRNIRVRELP